MNPMVWPISQQRGAEEDLGMTATRGFSTQQEASSSGYPDGTNSASSGGAPNALGVSAGPYYPRSSYYNSTTHCRSSQQNGSSGGEAGNGGGSFSHCVEPPTHGSQQGGSSVMCAGGPPSPGGKFETQVMQDNGGDSSGGGGSGGGGGGGGSGGGGGGDGGGGFMGDAVLTMISGSPEYSQQLEVEQRRRRQQQHQMQIQQHQQMQHEQQMQLQHQQQGQHQQQQQQQSSSRNSLGGHWPPSQGQGQGQGNFTEEWGVLLNRSSTPTMGTTTQVPNGFSASPWPSIHNPGEKQPWGSTQQHYPHQQDRQQLEQHRQEGQQDEDVQGSPSQQAVGGPGQQSYSTTFLSQQQGNGWSAPRITPARPLSPQNRGGPAVFNSYGDKEMLPSILGSGGGGGRSSSVHDSADASDVGADVDGGVSSSQQQQQINPHATAAGFQDGLRMLVEAHTATNSTSNGNNNSSSSSNSNDPNAAAVATVSASAAQPRGVLEMASLTRTPSHSTPAAAAAVAAAQAAAGGGGVEGGGGGMMRDGDPAGRARAKVRPAPPGTPGGTGGGRASKCARTGGMGKADGGGGAGGGKADGAGGGGPDSKSVSRRATRQSEESLQDLLPEERLRRSRERNRDHSRRSRERKKAFVEGLKKQVTELGAYRMLVEEAHDLISAHSTDVNAVFTFASGGFDRLLGMDPAELLGVSFLELVDPSDSQEVLRSVLSTLRRGGIRQVQYRMRPPAGAHAAEVETSFRLVSTRLVAVTRVRGRSPSPNDSPPQPLATLPMSSTSQVPPPSPLLVQALPPGSGGRGGGVGAGGAPVGSLPLAAAPEFTTNEW